MSNLESFLNSEGEDLLSQEEMAFLEGGDSESSSSDINAIAHCGDVTNNCNGGNCAAGCGSQSHHEHS